MAQNDWVIGLIAELKDQESKKQINADILNLEKQLDKIKLTAELDFKDKSQIDAIKQQLNNLKINIDNVDISPAAINNLVAKINQGLQNIQINNIGVNFGNNVAGNVGNVISQQVQDAIENVTSPELEVGFRVDPADSGKFENEVSKIITDLQKKKSTSISYKLNTVTEYDKDADEYIEKLAGGVFRYVTATGEAIQKTIAFDSAQGKWVERSASYSKTLEATAAQAKNATSALEKFEKAKKHAVANQQNTLNQVIGNIEDKNHSRPITSTEELNKVEKATNEAKSAMVALGNATEDTFDDLLIKAKEAITNLKIAEKQARNADNVSTKMKGSDLQSGISIAENDLNKLKAEAKDFPQMIATIDKLDTAIKNVGDASSLNDFTDQLRVARSELAKIKSETTAYNRSEKVEINKSGLQSKITDLQKISPEINKFEAEINGAKVTVSSLLKDLENVKTQSDFSVVSAKWRAFVDSAKASGIAVRDIGTSSESTAKKIESIQTALKRGDYSTQFSNLEKTYKQLGFTSDEIKDKTEAVRAALARLKEGNLDTLIQDEKAFADALRISQNEATQLKNDLTQIYNPSKQSKLSTDIQNWLSKNTRASKDAKQSLQEYYRELSGGKVSVDRLNYIEKELREIDTAQRGLGKLGKSLKDQFKQAGASFTQWLSVSSAVMLGIQKTKDAVKELKELDSILTEIIKTSDLTTSQLKKLGDTAFETASKYGKKASDYLTGVQEMYRAGFDNAEEMAKLSLLAQSAGDMDATSANNYLMATNAAYKYKGSVEELNKVLDGQNYITNNAAISMKDISDATSETASVAAQYGVQINELSALIATATANTRESGSEVGTALKAILINLQDTTSKPVTETFDSLGISMTKVVNGADKLKTPIELIYELADAYNKLEEGDVKRANILNEIGQKRHANTLASILSDMESYEKMLNLYSNASADGSALREAEKSANNLQGSLNKLSNTWTDTVENIVDSNALKTAVNMLNGLLTRVNAVTKALGSWGSIGLGAGIFARFKNVGINMLVAYLSNHYCFELPTI